MYSQIKRTLVTLTILGSLATAQPINMLALQEGTLPIVVPPTYSGWEAVNMLDDSSKSGWACSEGSLKNNVFVFEVIEPTTFERFVFDNASVDSEGAAVKDILVEVSTTSATSGYTNVLETTLANITDNQSFNVTQKLPAKWVRLTLKSNYGSSEWMELFSFKGFGEKPAMSTPQNISGTYNTNYSLFHVLQEGTALMGCYESNEGLLNGSIEGRVMKITWEENGKNGQSGPALFVFAKDGKSFKGFWWHKGKEIGAPDGKWDGKKVGSKVGTCPHWSGSLGRELEKQLTSQKRAKVYGILFDFNQATIRSESKPVLDEVVALMHKHKEWKFTIEGHTDAIGSDAANQTLSQKRADAVKTYLIEAKIDASRLQSKGYGEANPVASNESELGRAQNRRVELVLE